MIPTRFLILIVALTSAAAWGQEQPDDGQSPSVSAPAPPPAQGPQPPPQPTNTLPQNPANLPQNPPIPQDTTPPAPGAAGQPTPTLATKIGKSFPEELINSYIPWGFKILLHGYLRAPLRLTFADRGASKKPGESQYNIRTPFLVDDDYFRSGFGYTRLQEQDWAEIYLGVGNKWLTGEVAFMGSLYSDWAVPLISNQFGIAQGWLTFHWDKTFKKLVFRLRVRGGAFWDRFGYLEDYDTYLFGRTHQLGAQARAEWETGRWNIFLLNGVGAHLEDIASNQGLTLLNYVSAGVQWQHRLEIAAYFLDQTEQDQRQLKDITDANARVYGLDARLNTPRFGNFYVGGSILTADASTFLSPALEILHAYGGRGLSENYFGTDSSENGTGRLYSVAFQHRYSLSQLLRSAAPQLVHGLRGGDLSLKWFGLATYVLSKQSSNDPLINKNGKTLFKWGAEVAWSALSWLGISLRYDRVTLDSNDDANSFRILTPRITIRTHWLVDGELYLQYSHYWYGDRIQLRPGQVPLETKPDSDVLKIQAQFSF